MKGPFISVIMPVYNGAVYLREAIDCILCQTYDHFEFIIINDGSTDESANIVNNYDDSRIRYYEQDNCGLAATLNRGIELSKGKYIARQDQDDISFPNRFEGQINFLEANPDYGMVGTWAEIWIGKKRTKRNHKHPSDNLMLQFDLLFTNPFVHSSMMIRRSVFDEVGMYTTDTYRQPPEDYELWSRVARRFKVANIPAVLQVYREVPRSISRTKMDPVRDRTVNISRENLLVTLKNSVTAEQMLELSAMMHGAYHLLTSNPYFHELSHFVVMAADILSDFHHVPRSMLKGRVRSHLRILRNRYLSYRYGKLCAVPAYLMKSIKGLTV